MCARLWGLGDCCSHQDTHDDDDYSDDAEESEEAIPSSAVENGKHQLIQIEKRTLAQTHVKVTGLYAWTTKDTQRFLLVISAFDGWDQIISGHELVPVEHIIAGNHVLEWFFWIRCSSGQHEGDLAAVFL